MGQNNQKDQKGPKMTAAVMLVQNNQKIWSPHISHTILKVRFFWDTLYIYCAIYCKREMTRWSWLSYTPFAKSSGLCLENHLLDNRRPAYIWWYVNVSWLMWSHVVSFQVAHDLLLSLKFCHQIATFSTRTKCKIVSIINKT